MNPATELPLKGIHLPDPISWWPPALGWWLVFGITFILLNCILWMIWKYFRPNLKKQAVKALDRIERAFHENEDAQACLAELSIFLRRAVLSRKQTKDCASLTGEAWLKILDQPLKKPEFSQGAGQILLNGPYQAYVEKEDVAQAIELCRKWVKYL